MSPKALLPLCLLALLPSTLLAAPGQTSVPASKDNTLWNDPAGETSGGATEGIYAGRAGAQAAFEVRRALIAFDVASQVPAGAIVTGATLRLNMNATVSGPQTIRVYRVLQDWGESFSFSFGGKGAQAEVNDATWLHTFYNNQFWNTVGGDFSSTLSADQVVDSFGFYDWQSAQLTADVQSMLDNPAGNFGWVLRGNESQSQSVKQFASRDSSFTTDVPELIVDWTLPAVNYCTAGTSSNGCQASLSVSGSASATQTTGFVLSAATVEGNKDGLFFFGTNGRQANAWGNGTSFQCVVPPVNRGGLLRASGLAGQCDGAFAQDLNARWQAKPNQNPGAGALVQAQLWFRDPANTSNQTTSLSDAIEFAVGP